ncbi:Agamous-like MADS-box protein AGL16 [Zea mays]|uniref:Agamous-like MADS-box protein AGL16 n=1 Tax=Zea mays TaxID=4577 RepID=A0A1D6HJ98_MAIZE|nr:Agamous-like MADS-box protein AGL16 [Zea mays]
MEGFGMLLTKKAARKLTVLPVLPIALAKGGSKLEATTAQLARKPQDHLLKSEIEVLQRKGSLIHQENMELSRRVHFMSQQKEELYRKLQASEPRGAAGASSSTPYSFCIATQQADAPVNLEQRHSQPKEGNRCQEFMAPELG